ESTTVADAERSPVGVGELPTRSESIELKTLAVKDPVDRAPTPVPSLNGESLREAVRKLHAAGFRVQIVDGDGGARETSPPAGTMLPRGSLVRIRNR
ncbi:MAG: PASTA domain-containing protein, partial [Gemmatimonadota bacterium]